MRAIIPPWKPLRLTKAERATAKRQGLLTIVKEQRRLGRALSVPEKRSHIGFQINWAMQKKRDDNPHLIENAYLEKVIQAIARVIKGAVTRSATTEALYASVLLPNGKKFQVRIASHAVVHARSVSDFDLDAGHLLKTGLDLRMIYNEYTRQRREALGVRNIDLRRMARDMRHELKTTRMHVALVKGQNWEQDRYSKVRVVDEMNPEWYRKFCATISSERVDRLKWKKHKTRIKRKSTLRSLARIAGGKPDYLYDERLFPFVQHELSKRYDEQREIEQDMERRRMEKEMRKRKKEEEEEPPF